MKNKNKKVMRKSVLSQNILFGAFVFSILFFGSGLKANAATGDITAIRIVGASTTVTDTTSACNTASACTGWVAEIDMDSLNTGGVYNLGIGASVNPSSAKIVCTVTSPGYDTSGNATTVSRTVYGTHQLRKSYNASYTAPYPNDEIKVGNTFTTRIALSDFVYSGDTNVSCTVGAGIYNDGTNSSKAATNFSVTNSSTLGYPRAIANWTYPGWQRITGSNFTVRAVGFQKHAKNKRPLAAMVFTATDQHGHSNSVTVNDMTIDSSMGDAVSVQEYIGTIPTTGFTQADLITVNFKALPWVGDSNAVMDTSDGVNSQPTPLYAPIYFIYDGAGTYGTAAAVVDGTNGNDSTCVAVAESAFNGTNDAATLAPCATENKAITQVRAYNAAHSSPARTDEAGTVYFKAGTYLHTGASVAIGASSGTNADKTWLTLKPFPGVAKADVVINGITSITYNKTGTTPLHVEGLTVNVTSGAPTEIFNANTTSNYLWVDKNNLTMTSGSTLAYNYGSVYWTNNSVGVGGVKNGFTRYGANSQPALVRGNNLTNLVNNITFFTMVGNIESTSGTNTAFYVQAPEDNTVSTQPILAYNKLFNTQTILQHAVWLFNTASNPIGAAIVQNLVEYNNSNGPSAVHISADGSTNTPVNNVMFWHNTISGQRINRSYNDSGSSLVLRTLWSEIGTIYESTAIKSDTFDNPTTHQSAGRVGNWACLYSVGYYGTVDAEAGTSTNPVGVAGLWQPEFPGFYSKFIRPNSDAQSSTQAPQNTAGMHPVTWLGFVNRAGWDGVSVGSGNGDYHLTSSSSALNMIPAGQAVLPYDLDGVARKNDGTGAAGAYEYVPADSTAPTTSANIVSGTYNSVQSVTLTCDDGGGVGCDKTYYTLDGSDPTTSSSVYSSSITIPANATTILKFFSQDKNSNSESYQTKTYIIDTLAPSGGSFTINGGATQTNSTNATLNITCPTDSWSPVQVAWGNTASPTNWAACATSKSLTLPSGDGSKTAYVRFQDGGGNATSDLTQTINLDTTPPVTTASPTGGTYGLAREVTLSCDDGSGSGCDKIYYTTDGNDPTTSSSQYSTALNIATTTTLKFFSQDNAGNSEIVQTENYVIDSTYPLTTINSTPNSLTNSTSASFSFSADKGGSTYQCQLDGGAFAVCTSPQAYSNLAEGSHTFAVKATDTQSHTEMSPPSYTWTVDTTSPTISGVTDSATYYVTKIPTFTEGTAALNNNPYTSGTAISDAGDYTLILTDAANNSSTVHFSIVKEKTITDTNQVQADYTAGAIAINGSDPNNTDKATFNVDYTIQTGNITTLIPENTQMTKTGGGNLDITQLTSQEATVSDLTTVDVIKAIKFGIPNLELTFSSPITITINVGSEYNGQTLTVYYQNEGESTWNQETTCTVSSGNCTFQTTHATKFAATQAKNSPIDNTSSSSHHHKKSSHHHKKKKSTKSYISPVAVSKNLQVRPGGKISYYATAKKGIDHYSYILNGKITNTPYRYFFLPKNIPSGGVVNITIKAYDTKGNFRMKTVRVRVL